MRTLLLLGAVVTLACTDHEPQKPPPPPPPQPRSPVGLVGDWLRVAPASLRGDTLTLHADSTAVGTIPWVSNGKLAIIKRWNVTFTSRDAVVAREDWAQGHSDGGDGECIFGNGAGCISGPILCVGAGKQYQCGPFKYTPDSLILRESQFVRISRVPRRS